MYNGKVYRKQDAAALVVKAKDGGAIEGQASAGGDTAQASHIADIANDANGTAIATAVNAILAALENVGILKSS